MKHIIEITCVVAQGAAIALLAGAMVGVFAGSAVEVFRWISQ